MDGLDFFGVAFLAFGCGAFFGANVALWHVRRMRTDPPIKISISNISDSNVRPHSYDYQEFVHDDDDEDDEDEDDEDEDDYGFSGDRWKHNKN